MILKKKKKLFLLLIVLLTLAIISYFFKGYIMDKYNIFKKGNIKKFLRVDFYKIDRKKLSADKSAGWMQYKKGTISMDIKDSKLKKILQSPYHTKTGKKVDGIFKTYYIELKPGTYEHLMTIAMEISKFGYVSRIHKK